MGHFCFIAVKNCKSLGFSEKRSIVCIGSMLDSAGTRTDRICAGIELKSPTVEMRIVLGLSLQRLPGKIIAGRQFISPLTQREFLCRWAGEDAAEFLLAAEQPAQVGFGGMRLDIALDGGEFEFDVAAAHYAEAAFGFFPGGSGAGFEKNIEENAAAGGIERIGERGWIRRRA